MIMRAISWHSTAIVKFVLADLLLVLNTPLRATNLQMWRKRFLHKTHETRLALKEFQLGILRFVVAKKKTRSRSAALRDFCK